MSSNDWTARLERLRMEMVEAVIDLLHLTEPDATTIRTARLPLAVLIILLRELNRVFPSGRPKLP